MKICIVGHFSGNQDEGVKNVAYNILYQLSLNHEVYRVDIRSIYKHLYTIRRFNPSIVHFVVGPNSILSFILAKLVSLWCRNTKTVLSAVQPGQVSFETLIPLLKPDLVLAQSRENARRFKNFGCETKCVANGINTSRFVPVTPSEKEALRSKYHLPQYRFIILHVGHIKALRNLQLLAGLNSEKRQVLVIGSTSSAIESGTRRELLKAGCIVWSNYLDHIEEVYALADCYIFPTTDYGSCIEMPLSVLEAMSCNLAVITTRYKVLPDLFEPGNGLFYVAHEDELFAAINAIESTPFLIDTRQKVLTYSWENIREQLEEIYASLSAQ